MIPSSFWKNELEAVIREDDGEPGKLLAHESSPGPSSREQAFRSQSSTNFAAASISCSCSRESTEAKTSSS